MIKIVDEKDTKRYLKNRICCDCGSYDTYIDSSGTAHWIKCKCQKNICTKWQCMKCWQRNERKNNPNCINNIMKSLRNCRTGNQDPNSDRAKADRSQELACKLYGWEDLNKKYDNYNSPLDCYDPKTGLYHQVQIRYFILPYTWWPFANFEDEWEKIFEDMVCFCISEDGKIVERIYIFPWKVIIEKKGISIYKYDVKGNIYDNGWYEKFRVKNKEELNRANELWKMINIY